MPTDKDKPLDKGKGRLTSKQASKEAVAEARKLNQRQLKFRVLEQVKLPQVRWQLNSYRLTAILYVHLASVQASNVFLVAY